MQNIEIKGYSYSNKQLNSRFCLLETPMICINYISMLDAEKRNRR